MATLIPNQAGQLCLILRGVEENRILTTLRRWPHWQRADVERDPLQPKKCLAVSLFADPVHEDTIRQILSRSFGLVFPQEGGTVELPEPSEPVAQKGSRKRKR